MTNLDKSSRQFRTLAIRRHGESGYSLLMVVFMVATTLVLISATLPNLLTQGRRDREEEMVWRGEQYERAIGLYFRKFGKYPTKIDDLTKQTNGVRFLRQAYTDPMNKDDGSWRFIYVGPNGQLIGSVRSQSLLQSTLMSSTLGGASIFSGGMQPQPPAGATPGAGTTGTPGTGTPGTGTGGLTSGVLAPNPLASQAQPLGGTIIGGNIIGIGSKIKQASLRIYQGGDTYEKWEFIWNPTQQVAIPGQQAPVGPAAPGAPAAGQAAPGQLAPGQTPQTTPGAQPQQPAQTSPGGSPTDTPPQQAPQQNM